MKTSILVLGADGELRELIQASARRAFPNLTVTHLGSLDPAPTPPPTTPDLVIVAQADPEGTGPVQIAGLGACPVVVLSTTAVVDGAEVIPQKEWNEPVLARVFRSAVDQHHLREQLLRCQGDLLTIGRRINHDLRTPLGCILTTAETVQETLTEVAPAEASLVQAILQSTDDLLKLIERVSFLANASARPLPKTRLNMGMPFLSALQRLEWQMLKQQVTIAQPHAWPDASGVDSWLEVMWWNLLSNALRNGDPPLQIEAGWDRGAGEHRFWVSDQGPGIPEEQRSRMFTPFHQLHESSAGRGLGLALVQRLAELQGGRCSYEPRPGGGSRFHFTLPDAG